MAFHSLSDLRVAASTDGPVVEGLEKKAGYKNDDIFFFSVTFHSSQSAGYSIAKSASYRLPTEIIFSGGLNFFLSLNPGSIKLPTSCPLAAH